MKKNMKKLVASSLVLTTVMSNGSKVDACDSAAVLEVAQEISAACPISTPVVMGTAFVVITGVTVYGKCCTRNTNEESVYYTLGHLPPYWRPNSIMDKINPGGKVIQRRVYGPDGKAKLDIDLTHHGSKKYHPWTKDGKYVHAHDHVYGKNHVEYQEGRRRPGREVTDQEYQRYIGKCRSRKPNRKDWVRSLPHCCRRRAIRCRTLS